MYTQDEERDYTKMTLTFGCDDKVQDSALLKEPIEILAWSFGAYTQDASENNRNQVGCFQSLSLTKFCSIHSPALMKCTMKQPVLDEAILTCENKSQTITLKLKEVSVCGVSTGGSGGETRLTENITLNFKSIEMLYDDNLSEKKRMSGSGVLENLNQPTEKNRRYY